MHKVCLRAHKSLFKEDPSIQYEVSLLLDGLFEGQYEQREEEGQLMNTQPKNLVTKDNIDRVDLLLD